MPKTKKKANRKTKNKKVVQVYNPKTKHWIKIDMTTSIHRITHKKTEGAYKNIPKGKGKFYTMRQEPKVKPLTKRKKTAKLKTQKPKKRITHKLTYAPRKAIKDIVRSNGQQRLSDGKRKMEYTFKPDGKPDKTPNKIKDIGRANLRTQLVQLKSKKLQDLPKITFPDDAADILGGLSKNDREVVQVMYLNGQNKVIGIETAHKGSVNASITSPHEIMKTALLTNASSIILAHNHPSGDPTPSPEDISVTKKLKEAGKTVDVRVLDSIVIGKDKYYSLKQEGQM